MRRYFYLIPTVFLAFLSSVYSLEKIDGIAAFIDDEIILDSELSAYTMLRLNSLGIKSDTIDLDTYKRKFLDELIDGKVLLVHGKKDSTISISDDEVDQATNNHIKMLLQQNNITVDSLEAELKRQQGITLSKFKADARKIIKEQLLKQKVQQSYLYSNEVSKKDVEQFYNEYKDSLPRMGESVLLSKFVIEFSPSDGVRQSAYERITSIKQRLDNGEDFAELAKKYSEGPEASQGGDLGFISKGTLNEIVFEEKAFHLAPGQISEPFETRLGFHIINNIERGDQKIHVRQIFIRVQPPEDEVARVTARIDSIRLHAETGEQFINAVKKYSQDPVSKSNNGLMKWTSLLELPSDIRSAIDSLKKGEISQPVRNDQFLTIYRLEDRVAERTLSLTDDYLILEKKAKDIISQKKLISLVEQWKKQIYIDIRI